MRSLKGEQAPLLTQSNEVSPREGADDAAGVVALDGDSASRLPSNTSVNARAGAVAMPDPRKVPLSWRLNSLVGRKNSDLSRRVFPTNTPAFDTSTFPHNEVNNRRYSLLSFLPVALVNQFRFSFFNVYFLLVAVSQFIPALQVGFIFIYFAPLAFVVGLSLAKEAFDDIKRWIQDRKINSEKYEWLCPDGSVKQIAAREIRIGMLLKVHSGQRIPADLALLWTSESNGACFVRTDQLDGETDWKLRYPGKATRDLRPEQLAHYRMNVECEPPSKAIDKFEGRILCEGHDPEGLNVNNALWCSCTVASGSIVGVVIYTGTDTRSSMNMETAPPKRGLIDGELNWISLLCFLLLMVLSALLVVQQYLVTTIEPSRALINFSRFQILLSSVIPISMRVNLDIARLWYAFVIFIDKKCLPGVVVRNTNVPEELGRLSYLFSDKTGTLTRNQMEFRTLHLDDEFSFEHTDEADMKTGLKVALGTNAHQRDTVVAFNTKQANMILRAVKMLALCHNVTPVHDEQDPVTQSSPGSPTDSAALNGGDPSTSGAAAPATRAARSTSVVESGAAAAGDDASKSFPAPDPSSTAIAPINHERVEYQAASPDEIAMVKFASKVGIHLRERTVTAVGDVEGEMLLDTDYGRQLQYDILKTFPFSSERKCMGIIIRDRESGQIQFLMKGADTKMVTVLSKSSWVEERCGTMAKSGRRTLVFAQKDLSASEYRTIARALAEAGATPGQEQREAAINRVLARLECNMTLVCATGVEDQLQENVIQTLERLGACGIKVWMLTGDKVETAQCIGRSTKLVPPNCWEQEIIARDPESFEEQLTRVEEEIGDDTETKWSLLVDGGTLHFALADDVRERFVDIAKRAHAVIVARCSPTQKAEVVSAVKSNCASNIRTAAIGDGGNDVSMILAAHIGFGIEGVEGKQASMAADFSITQFSHCERLITWHGRNSYNRSCILAQFIMHRGIVYAIVQVVFSLTFSGSTMSVFNGWLIMLYPTFLTMAPVFALVLDEDRLESEIDLFPELYKDLLKSRAMNTRSFLQWVWLSFFQGGLMMYLTLQFFSDEFFQIVSIAFTALLLTELTVVAAVMHFRILWRQRRLHFGLFMLAELASLAMFFAAVEFLPDTFDQRFFWSWEFWQKILIIAVSSIAPLVVFGFVGTKADDWVVGRHY